MSITQIGDQVQIHYTGRFEDGTVFASSEGREPLEFQAGGDEVIPGLSQAVVGMELGESKTVEVEPENAYGPWKPGLDHRVPREMLPEEAELGDPLRAQVGDNTMVVWITELGDDFAVLDANHPLAGRTLIFDIEVVSLNAQEGGLT